MRRVTVNVGVMQGGVKINMLPAECVLDIDLRLPVGIARAAAIARVEAIAARYPEVRCEELAPDQPEATWSDPEHEMVGHLARNAAAAGGRRPQPIVGLGATDTRFWRARGVPAFVYGCSPAGMGAANESVRIVEFHQVLRTHALAAFDYLTAVGG